MGINETSRYIGRLSLFRFFAAKEMKAVIHTEFLIKE